MQRKTLAIYWLNGKFIALNIHKGEVKAIWTCPEPVNEENDFKTLLNEAVNQTGFNGDKVCVLIGSRKMMHHIIEVPPVKGADLEYYIERKANQLKTFDEPLAYSYWRTPPTRVSESVLVNIYPRSFLEKIAGACHESGLHLSKMFTLHAPLQHQLTSLPTLPEEVVALAAETDGTTTLLIGRKDGKIYFGRTIYSTWRVEQEYLGTEIMRSILFVKQQFGVMATKIFIFGNDAAQWTKPLESICGLHVEARQFPLKTEDWVKETIKISEDTTENLVTADWRKEPQTRLFLKMVGFLAVVIIAIIAGWMGYVEKEIRVRSKLYNNLQPVYTQLQTTHKEILERKIEIEHRKETIQFVTDNSLSPVPGWFFGYLSDVLPDDFVLKELHVYWTNGVWKARISGIVQPVGEKTVEQALFHGMQTLQNTLERSPFHFKVTDRVQIAAVKREPEGAQPPSDSARDISSGIGIRREAGIAMLGDSRTNQVKRVVPPFLEKPKTEVKPIFWLEGVMQ